MKFKIKLKQKLSYCQADTLIEKYYDGLNTGDEEKRLRKFLLQQDLPEQYKPEQAIFGYFELKKEKKHIRMHFYQWTGVAAVVALIVTGQLFFFSANQSNYAYIDGKKVSDIYEIKSQAMNSLGDISSSKDEVQESFKNINDNVLIEQQLDVFSKQ